MTDLVNDQVQVAIPLYGDLPHWRRLAARAAASVAAQTVPTACRVIEAASLADARNQALRELGTPFVILLDADDTLDTRYVEHMLAGAGDVRWPSFDRNGVVTAVETNPLPDWNPAVVASMADREMLLDVGGFRDLPCLEDFDAWCRMWAHGADLQPCLDAVYYYTPRAGGRMDRARRSGVHDGWAARIRDEARSARVRQGAGRHG